MGWHMLAYYRLDQDEVNKYINQNNIDIFTCSYDQKRQIARHFYEKLSGDKIDDDKMYELPADYYYNKTLKIHEIIEDTGVNYIRDHEGLKNDHPMCKLPFHLSCCLTVLDTDEDAKKIAKDLRLYFPDDDKIDMFATWLERTSQYCYAYKLDD